MCTGRGDRVFWTFLGFGANPIANSSNRQQIFTTETVNGTTQTTATLLFNPVIARFPESYVCQIIGDNPIGVNVRVVIDTGKSAATSLRGCFLASSSSSQRFFLFPFSFSLTLPSPNFTPLPEPAAIISRAPTTFDISGHTVGDPFSFPCQVDTCIDNYHVRFRRNNDEVHSVQANNIANTTFNYEFNVQPDSAGTYSCFAHLPSFNTTPETITLTGEVSIKINGGLIERSMIVM